MTIGRIANHHSIVLPSRNHQVSESAKDEQAVTPESYDPPSLDDLFEGSKPKFGKIYDKYIASTQVPHAVEADGILQRRRGCESGRDVLW